LDMLVFYKVMRIRLNNSLSTIMSFSGPSQLLVTYMKNNHLTVVVLYLP
jgi:hypothetical protein